MKVPIRIESIEEQPDGSAKINIEFDEDIKRVLMQAWGVTEWDDARAQKEFIKVIRESLDRGSKNAEGC
jgi:hypothetical protein